jgi:geranylgeranyl diphosphate/geranylgeranyl-bacteriochlorophyllide a reductase
MADPENYDVVVVGGGPAGATAAADLARRGRKVLLLDRAGRIKPCGGAIPPRLIRDFEIPDELLVARITSARMVSPTGKHVDIPIEDGFVGMVDREAFDEWLRERAVRAGAVRRTGTFERILRDDLGGAIIEYASNAVFGERLRERICTRTVIGADGANSTVAKQAMLDGGGGKFVFAYHEIIRSPKTQQMGFDPSRCDVIYRGAISPDFYSWVFPHGETTSVGTGSACKGFSLKAAVSSLRASIGLGSADIIRCEGAPIPLRPLRKWDNGRDVVLAGDAAGVVAPASGEGIYYAMFGGCLAADAIETLLATGDFRALKSARKRFMKAHGRVFWILGIMQFFWYRNDKRRERFVKICADRDVQRLTFEAYMNKELVRAKPMAHVRIFFKDLRHLLGLARA